MTDRTRRSSFYLWIAGAIVALDQVAKALVDRHLELHESRTIVEGLARLTYVQNRGAAFGILSEADLPYQSVLFSLVSVIALGAIAVYAWKLPFDSRLPRTALALIMGGAVGNLLDRVRLGYVIDYVDVYITGRRSTSRTPRSASASRCWCSTSCAARSRRPRRRTRRSRS
jgi:signal peptidase II